MKKIIKISACIILLLFIIVFLNRNNNYYENQNILTQEAIERFEKDLKEGKEILPSNYLEPEKNYNNKISTLALKTSSLIEHIVDKTLKEVLKYLVS